MLELTLASLLNTMSADFCALMETEKDVVKATLIAYSMATVSYTHLTLPTTPYV